MRMEIIELIENAISGFYYTILGIKQTNSEYNNYLLLQTSVIDTPLVYHITTSS